MALLPVYNEVYVYRGYEIRIDLITGDTMKNRMPVFVIAVLLVVNCAKEETMLSKEQAEALLEKVDRLSLEQVEQNEVAVLVTNYGKMVFEFFPQKAPQHCASFKRLVRAGYFNGVTFHRIIKGFMIQGGDLNTRLDSTIQGKIDAPGFTLPAEFNDIPHDKGILSMARAMDPNSAGSQFFICLSREQTSRLDGKYTVFGRLIDGMPVLEQIGNVETKMSPWGEKAAPVNPVVLEKAYMAKR